MMLSDNTSPDVFIATPSHSGDVCAQYSAALLATIALLGQHGLSTKPLTLTNNAIISFARALLAQHFLESGAEHLLFIDADLSWDPQGALALIRSPHDVIGGVYPAKTPDYAKVFQTRHMRETATGNLIETDGIPGGFMRIRRRAMLKMKEAYPETRCNYKGIDLHLLFENMILADGTPLGEDYAFCERWRRIGGKIFIYPDISFSHFGRHEWQGNMLNDCPQLKVVP